jgi:hypothetical protein
MGFKSEAQRKKFQEMVKDGKIAQSVYDAFESDTGEKLPERLHKKAVNSIADIRKNAEVKKVGKIKKI